MRLVIAGGREFNNYGLLKKEALSFIQSNIKDGERVIIVSGKARGADSLGEKFAEEMKYFVKEFPAQWQGKGDEGLDRNKDMAKYSTHALLFWDGKSRGTKHMISMCKMFGLTYKIIYYR